MIGIIAGVVLVEEQPWCLEGNSPHTIQRRHRENQYLLKTPREQPYAESATPYDRSRGLVAHYE